MRWHRPGTLRLHRSATFLRLYRYLPHGLLGRLSRALARATRPRWAIDLAVRRWTERAAIRMDDYLPGPFASLESFFLRRLRPGARPIGDGFIAPVDGVVVGAGPIAEAAILQIKGVPLSLARLTSGRGPVLPLADYEGGRYTTIFLTPHGYHYVHMPLAGTVVDLRWISGRAFPQNQDALRHIPRIYERNERVTLRCRSDAGPEFLLVMVGASLIGGIHLQGRERRDFVRPYPVPWGRHFARGEELGHFSFGSTVVLLVPPALAGLPPPLGAHLRMGQRLW
ncbi:archaetidylserine decarboxylase [Nannocystis sp.]|uniref:archaetidylserine decarboxylase n=1 Tax=Nannocystis sp. TaxID=1962667 RepID=UPI00242862BF|nr:archaetidylserine decarboxylase [Nannocystis sp.]MBK7827662.1 phosphatidylserine decarboxylase [Nannocystis sp.]MBK9753707.1 phosphatidylserine decarboxylase [Nannocystis sp.]